MTVRCRELVPGLAAVSFLICSTSLAATEPERPEASVAAADVAGPVPDHTPSPVYPDFARQAGIDGTILLHVLVGVDGRVKSIKVVKSVVGLDQAALDAVKQWTFLPAHGDGKRVAAWTAVPIIFKMGGPLPPSPPPPRAEAKPVPGLPTGYKLADLTIELSRTGCFGTCPAYRLLVRGTGYCTYIGGSYVLQKTEIPFHLEPSVVVDLLNDLYAMDFFSLNDSYVERHTVRARADGTVEHFGLTVSDDPHQIVTVQIGAYTKRVEKNSMYGPKELVALGEKIDAITNSSQWIKAPR